MVWPESQNPLWILHIRFVYLHTTYTYNKTHTRIYVCVLEAYATSHSMYEGCECGCVCLYMSYVLYTQIQNIQPQALMAAIIEGRSPRPIQFCQQLLSGIPPHFSLSLAHSFLHSLFAFFLVDIIGRLSLRINMCDSHPFLVPFPKKKGKRNPDYTFYYRWRWRHKKGKKEKMRRIVKRVSKSPVYNSVANRLVVDWYRKILNKKSYIKIRKTIFVFYMPAHGKIHRKHMHVLYITVHICECVG